MIESMRSQVKIKTSNRQWEAMSQDAGVWHRRAIRTTPAPSAPGGRTWGWVDRQQQEAAIGARRSNRLRRRSLTSAHGAPHDFLPPRGKRSVFGQSKTSRAR